MLGYGRKSYVSHDYPCGQYRVCAISLAVAHCLDLENNLVIVSHIYSPW